MSSLITISYNEQEKELKIPQNYLDLKKSFLFEIIYISFYFISLKLFKIHFKKYLNKNNIKNGN